MTTTTVWGKVTTDEDGTFLTTEAGQEIRVGWIELFAHNEGGPLVSIPGVSRFINVSQKEGK